MATPRKTSSRGPMREVVDTWTADGERFERLACGHEAPAKRDASGRYTTARRRCCQLCSEPMAEFASRPQRNLRRLRLAAGLTETALGLRIWPDAEPKVVRGRIWSTAAGHWPTPDRIEAMAAALGVDPVEFYQPLDEAGETTRPAGAIRLMADRLRNGGQPEPGDASVAVSLRLSPGVLAAVRDVAGNAGVRAGAVVVEALERAVSKAAGVDSGSPFGLEPVDGVTVDTSPRSKTLAVKVPESALVPFLAGLGPREAPTRAIGDAFHAMLRDLGFTLC